MANHKRRRPKHQRGGCLYCKPHKDERAAKATPGYASSEALRQDILDRLGEYLCQPRA